MTDSDSDSDMEAVRETATFALGGFWGAEAIFRYRDGVTSTRVGYMGGSVADPTPDQVATNTTGHAEVVEVTFDPTEMSYARLLEIFWGTHDPTATPRHGSPSPDRHRFRSVVFVHDDEQRRLAEASRAGEQRAYDRPIVTQIVPVGTFWPAPDDQQLRLEKRGMYATGHSGPGQSPPWEQSPSAPEHRRSHDALLEEFGAALGGMCSWGWIELLLLGDQRHVGALVHLLRAWLRVQERERPRVEPVLDGDAQEKLLGLLRGHHGRRGLDRGVLSADRGSATTAVMVHRDAAQFVFITNHQPGNFLTRVGDGDNVRHTWVGPYQFDSRIDVFGGGGHWNWQTDLHKSRPRSGPPASGWNHSRASADWYQHVPPATLHVACDGPDPHVLRFSDGALSGGHSSVEAERERTLVGLGADKCSCFRILDAWNPRWVSTAWDSQNLPRFFDDLLGDLAARPRFEVPGSDPETVELPQELLRHGRDPLPDPASASGLSQRPQSGPWQSTVSRQVLGVMMRTPEPFRLRWYLAGLASLESRRDSIDRFDRTLLETGVFAAVRGAALGTLWQWCRSEPSISYGVLDLRYLERGETPWAEGVVEGDTARMTIAVPFRWLTHVWTRGVATIDDHVVLDAVGPAEAHELDVTVVAWHDPGGDAPAQLRTQRATARWNGADWHLTNMES